MPIRLGVPWWAHDLLVEPKTALGVVTGKGIFTPGCGWQDDVGYAGRAVWVGLLVHDHRATLVHSVLQLTQRALVVGRIDSIPNAGQLDDAAAHVLGGPHRSEPVGADNPAEAGLALVQPTFGVHLDRLLRFFKEMR